MTRAWHILFHIGAVVVQYGVIASGVIPQPYGAYVAAGVAALQGAVAAWNHAKGVPQTS